MARTLAVRYRSVLLALAILAIPSAAMAEPVCAKRDQVLKQLAHDYDEAPTAIGVLATGGVMEILTSSSGTWTVIVTLPTGVSCLIAAGENWATKPIAKTDSPA